MLINKLEINNLRNLEQVEVSAHPRLNTIHGVNGAGKTSILEAIVILSRGRSFRGRKTAQLIGPEGSSLSVFAELKKGPEARENTNCEQAPSSDEGSAQVTRIGIERSARQWKARRNGRDVSQISELAESLAVVVMEPDSHALVSGSPEVRRRYVDWGVFHVEPAYLPLWRRYARALKQRNAAIRNDDQAVLPALDAILAENGEAMTALRETYVAEVRREFETLIAELSPGLGEVSLRFQRGWAGEGLAQALVDQRAQDLKRGSTQIGPHRADLDIRLRGSVIRDTVSRGEQKVLATALVLAQARRQCETGRIPVLLLDDLASEFDRNHFDATLRVGLGLGVQMWITGVEQIDPGIPHSRFHVEHGKVRKMV